MPSHRPLPSHTCPVVLTEVRQETPTIKSFLFDCSGQPFTFFPGQWVDLFVQLDGDWQVGGYSMTSSPTLRGVFQLSVKAAQHHPVSRYLHESARVGDTVYVSTGQGNFYYRADAEDANHGGRSLVLLGAGIGVTPLLSILRYVADAVTDVPCTLVYSAKSVSEFLFYDELASLSETHANIRCEFTVTGEAPEWTGLTGRIGQEMLQSLHLDPSARYYFCGPREFVDDMARTLTAMGIGTERQVFERWW